MSLEFPDPAARPSLSGEEMERSLRLLLDPAVNDAAKEAFLTTLHSRGETSGELAGFAKILLERAVRPEISRIPGRPLLELCGTGGDRAGLLNISTAAMFVAAGAGARVVKHGNRAASSRCGSADVLEALGVALHLRVECVPEVLERAGCVFLLASDFHLSFAAVAPLRRTLAARGQTTVFNLLGPLLNPAMPECQLAGIFRGHLLAFYAGAMRELGRLSAWAVHGSGGEGGLDELSITGPTRVAAYSAERGGEIEEFQINPRELGFSPAFSPESLVGGDAPENARRITQLLGGERSDARDMIILNAAASLRVAGMVGTLSEGVALAAESIDSGRALNTLRLLKEASAAAAR